MLPLTVSIILILIGMYFSAEWCDRYWRHKRLRITMTSHTSPTIGLPFRTSLTQCIGCGHDDMPLSIDTGECIYCFERGRTNG